MVSSTYWKIEHINIIISPEVNTELNFIPASPLPILKCDWVNNCLGRLIIINLEKISPATSTLKKHYKEAQEALQRRFWQIHILSSF